MAEREAKATEGAGCETAEDGGPPAATPGPPRDPVEDGGPPRKAARGLSSVHQLHLPTGPLVVGIECVPRLMLLNGPQDHFVARWLRVAPAGNVALCDRLLYTPTEEDATHHLRLEVTPLDADGSLRLDATAAVESASPVTAYFAPRKPRALVRKRGSDAEGSAGTGVVESSAGGELRVLTYNVLSQRVAKREFYPHCPAWALRWPFRWRSIARELREARADLLCLQEVEPEAWDSHFEPHMREQGYLGVLAPKRTRGGGALHGCASLFRASAWELVAQRTCTLSDMLLPDAGRAGLPAALLDEARGKGTLALLLALRARAPAAGSPRAVLLVNTHLHWEASKPQLKALQMQLVLEATAAFRLELGSCKEWPLVVGADLNSLPRMEHELELEHTSDPEHTQSGVYALLRDGRLDASHPHHPAHARPADTSASQHAAPAFELAVAPPLEHALELESAYAHVLGSEPPYTNFTVGFVGTLDYIWLERGLLRAHAVLALPERAELTAHTALPSCVHPSDHLPLVACVRSA